MANSLRKVLLILILTVIGILLLEFLIGIVLIVGSTYFSGLIEYILIMVSFLSLLAVEFILLWKRIMTKIVLVISILNILVLVVGNIWLL